MAKAVLISIRPEWVNKIVTGEKTVEVRKNRPNLKTPFKVYIYCTDGVGKNTVNIPITPKQLWQDYIKTGSMECMNCPIGNQKVIGEFVCDDILEIGKRGWDKRNFDYCYSSLREWGNDDIAICINAVRQSCVPREQLNQYGENTHCLYLWKMSKLKIYETPKDLSALTGLRKTRFGSEPVPCKHPPQNWRYVEELEQ